MSTNVGAIDFELLLNSNPFNKGLKNANMAVKNSGIESSLKKIGKLAVTAFSVKAITGFTKSCLELGSDLSEVQNVVDVTFGNLNGEIDKFAQNAIEQFGLGQTVTKKYAGTFGAMAKAFDFSNESALDMSKTLTGLVGDVASFYNLSSDIAYTKLKSVFTGETETLKDLGVVMTQNALDQYALANGYGKTTAKMTEQEKTALRYHFVLDKLSIAQGDFARTSDSWANQTRVLSLRFNELKATSGQGLINLFTPIVKGINLVLAKLQVLANAFKSFTEFISGKKADNSSGLGSASSDIANVANSANDANSAVAGIGESAKKSAKELNNLAVFDNLNVLPRKDSGGSGSGASGDSGALDFGNPLQDTIKQAESEMDGFTKIFEFMFDPLKKAWDSKGMSVINSIKNAFQGIKNLGEAIGRSFINIWSNGTIQKTIELNLQMLSHFFNIIGNIADAFAEAWKNAGNGDKIIQSLADAFNNLLEIKEGVLGVFEEWTASSSFQNFANAVISICGTLSHWFEVITAKLKEIWENGGKDAFTSLLEFGGKLVEIIGAVFERLSPVIDFVLNIVTPVISAIVDAIGWVIKALTAVLDFILNIFQRKLGRSLEWNRPILF